MEPATYKPNFLWAFVAGLVVCPLAGMVFQFGDYSPFVPAAATAAVVALGFALSQSAPSGPGAAIRTGAIHFVPALIGGVIGWVALIAFLLRGYQG
jgi:low affinity Fe/Cu permease